MPEEIALDNIQRMSGYAGRVSDNLGHVLVEIANKIATNSYNEQYREMAEWIKEHNGKNCVSMYSIQGDCHAQFIYELDKQMIPYITLQSNQQVLVRDKDFSLVKEINRGILIEKSNYYQDLNAVEMEDAIARIDRIRNKDILTVVCSDEIEAEVLKNKCSTIAAGFMVGTEKLHGKNRNTSEKDNYVIYVHGAKVLTQDKTKQDFCKAYLQMAFQLYGGNGPAKRQQILDEKAMEMKIARLKENEDTVYLVSDSHRNKFIEFNSNGFGYYETYADKAGKMRMDKKAYCMAGDSNYDVEVQKYTKTIYGKRILYSQKELQNHLENNAQNISKEQVIKSKHQYAINLLEDRITDKINEMIEKKLFCDIDMSNYNPAEKFELYRKEVLNLMSAMVEDIPPEGHSEEDFDYMMEMLYDSGRFFDTDYVQIMKRIRTVEVETHKAKARNRVITTAHKENSTYIRERRP